MALVKTFESIEVLFWNLLMDVLEADKASFNPMVRRSWNTEGAPDWRIHDNLVFMQLTEEAADDIAQPIDSILSEKGDDYLLREGNTRVLTLSLIAYGPNSYDNLIKILYALGRGHRSLRKEQIYPVPTAVSINRAPELFQGRWWERADMKLRFNCLMVKETDINRIASVPVTISANAPGNSEKTTTVMEMIQKG